MEYHPRVDRKHPKLDQSKIILGSFPIWSLTKHEINDGIIEVSNKALKVNREFPFFYGSSTNQFWKWYSLYIDPEIILLDVESIQKSLTKNNIGITDVILSCKRKRKSSLDKDLTQRVYNHQFFPYPKRNELIKILCTSKGVMNDMLLCKNFYETHRLIETDHNESMVFQNQIINNLNGCASQLKKPIFVQLQVENGGVIQCLSTPSPGSPYRRLKDFGLDSQSLDIYLNNYLSEAFRWFNS